MDVFLGCGGGGKVWNCGVGSYFFFRYWPVCIDFFSFQLMNYSN